MSSPFTFTKLRLQSALLCVLMMLASSVDAASFEQLLSPGPLSEAHSEFEEDCSSCHDPLGEKTQLQLCTACHENILTDVQAQLGFHGKHPEVSANECQTCHTEHEGIEVNTLHFDLSTFDHEASNFALHGAHETLACSDCHNETDPTFTTVSTACASCHQQDDPHADTLSMQCESCHTSTDWQPTLFDHATIGFPLTGAHAEITCNACHADTPVFPAAPTECASCHQQDDVHQGAFGTECSSCHSTSLWTQTKFDHASTGFLLKGAHASLSCASCHDEEADDGNAMQSLGTTCNACHQEDDPHEGRRGDECASCHNQQSWETVFDHTARTGFSLLGAHMSLECQACHTDGTSVDIPSTCVGCHAPDPHDNQLGSQCENCHNEHSFTTSIRFSHHLSHFPLLGVHATLACGDCHNGLRFKDTASNCHACHDKDDVHGGSMGTQCASCHNPANWQATSFDHGVHTGFVLTGAHEAVSCNACHGGTLNLNVSSESQCRQCHDRDDPHDGSFGSDCAQCHMTETFFKLKALP